jgi:hypothetical protein
VAVPVGASGEWRWSGVGGRGPAPPDRTAHATAVWGDAMVVFGGTALSEGNSGTQLADLWLLRKHGSGFGWSSPARHTSFIR